MKTFFYTLLFLISASAFSQDIVQNIKGKISDQQTGMPLEGVNLKVEQGSSVFSAQTDASGNFSLSVNVGRYKVTASHTGYSSATQEVLVIAGKESVLNFSIRENAVQLQEVEVSSAPMSGEIAGERSLTIEKTLRIPANYLDPVRAFTAYPGVVVSNDQGNSIIVRGNSPNGLLWRLNGVDIVNPNHLANAGTLSDRPMANGGGVNILSTQMLDRTNLYTGAIPSTFGNVLSGVIDMGMREGNKDKHEFTVQASLIGIDLAAEGPVSKNTSFTANYRYSTVGLLSAMGVNFGGESIAFQDLSFNLHHRGKKNGELSVFGVFGNSSNKFESKDVPDRKEDKDMYDINYKANTGIAGFNYTLPLPSGKLSIAAAYSRSYQDRNADISSDQSTVTMSVVSDDNQYITDMISSNIRYSARLSEKIQWDLGSVTNFIDNSIDLDKFYGVGTVPMTGVSVHGVNSGALIQPYTNFVFSPSSKLDLNAGVRYVTYTFNNTSSVEPRASMAYQLSSHSSFEAAYSLISQTQLPQVYATSGNHDLELTKSHHGDIAYRTTIVGDARLRTGLFFQKLYDVPSTTNGLIFSAINLLESTVPADLNSNGTGENYGADVTVEKEFFNKNYLLVGGSYYKSTFDAGDGVKRDSRFDGSYTVSAVHGKEWTKTSKKRTIGLNTRVLYLGGLRQSTVLTTGAVRGETVYDESNPYNQKLADYFRVDVRLSFRKNKPGYTRTLAFDIQNLTSQQNEAYQYYDATKGGVVTKFQLGIIPVIVYRIDF